MKRRFTKLIRRQRVAGLDIELLVTNEVHGIDGYIIRRNKE